MSVFSVQLDGFVRQDEQFIFAKRGLRHRDHLALAIGQVSSG
jgi:hypothetical protein